MNCFLNSIPIADDRVLSSAGGWELYREYDRNEFLKSIENKNKLMSNTSANNNTRIAQNTLLLFPVCYLHWLYLCVQAVLEKMP